MITILIVEDEILIADTIKRYLLKKGYEVSGIAISYEEALALIDVQKPDIALLDIRLSGEKTGVDLARYIQQSALDLPFIFLTSQLDSLTINAAKETFPAGYLSKPIQKESLYATIEITMHQRTERSKNEHITLQSGNESHLLRIEDIQYLEAEHVYVKVYLREKTQALLVRQSLKELSELLPVRHFVQSHRSYIINLKQVSSWDRTQVFIDGKALPISRSNKESVLKALEEL